MLAMEFTQPRTSTTIHVVLFVSFLMKGQSILTLKALTELQLPNLYIYSVL